MQYLKQEITEFTSSNITESTEAWDNTIVTAGSFVIGKSYSITTIGTTDFTLIGAASNTVGLIFTATGVGTGTGTAQRAYLINDYVLYGTFIYKCVADHTNRQPDTNNGIYWIKYAISNKLAMLDLSAQSKSYVDGGNLVVEFLQNRITTLGIGNYEAEYVQIDILDTDSTTVLWTYNTISSINLNVVDYYTYIYSPYGYEVDRAIKIDLPMLGYKIKCTFHKSAESTRSACGYLVGGTPVDMGQTLFGVSFSFNSFATKETDSFGTLNIVKRAVQDLVDFETVIPSNQVQTIRRNVKAIYNDIVLFIVDESATSEYENLLTLGVIESANIVLPNPTLTTMSWSIFEAI